MKPSAHLASGPKEKLAVCVTLRWALTAACVLLTSLAQLVGASPAAASEAPELALARPAGPVWLPQEPGYFALEEIAIPLAVRRGTDCETISAVLVQLSASLEAHLERRLLPKCRDVTGPMAAGPRPVSFRFRVPDVRRKSRFEWRFAACAREGVGCRSLLTVPFTAFPRNLLTPLKVWAEEHVLVVRDRDGGLQSFLDDQDIPFFERAAPSYPDAERMTLLVSKEKAVDRNTLLKMTGQGGVVVFRETRDGLPLVQSETMGPHRLITVRLPVVSALATDPYAQELLLELVRLSQGKEP